MNNKALIAVLVIAVLAFGGWYLWGGSNAVQPDEVVEQQEETMDKDQNLHMLVLVVRDLHILLKMVTT